MPTTPPPEHATLRTLTLGYMGLEILLLGVFWLFVLLRPDAAVPLLARSSGHGSLAMFVYADGVVLAWSAAAAATRLLKRRSGAGPWVLVHAGAAGYAGAATVGGCATGVFAWPAVALMVPPVVASVWLARRWWGRAV